MLAAPPPYPMSSCSSIAGSLGLAQATLRLPGLNLVLGGVGGVLIGGGGGGSTSVQ